MATRKQLSVTMENRPGTLATIANALAQRKVNILACSSMEHQGKSLVRLVVDKHAAAIKALQESGYGYTEEEVLATRLPNRAGTLATLAKTLGDAGVNIDYAYYGAEPSSRQVLVILSVSDLARAKKLLK